MTGARSILAFTSEYDKNTSGWVDSPAATRHIALASCSSVQTGLDWLQLVGSRCSWIRLQLFVNFCQSDRVIADTLSQTVIDCWEVASHQTTCEIALGLKVVTQRLRTSPLADQLVTALSCNQSPRAKILITITGQPVLLVARRFPSCSPSIVTEQKDPHEKYVQNKWQLTASSIKLPKLMGITTGEHRRGWLEYGKGGSFCKRLAPAEWQSSMGCMLPLTAI